MNTVTPRSGLLIVILVIIASPLFSQYKNYKQPDYEGIKQSIENKESQFYYPVLFNRYETSDTTLSATDFYYLYYGYLFHKNYTPYGSSVYQDSLQEYYSKKTMTHSDYHELIRLEKQVLQEFPFNMRNLNSLSYAYFQIGDTLSLRLADFKLDRIARTILASGDGKMVETGWHVISVEHEYDIIQLLGFKFSGKQSLIKTCDYLTLAKNKENIPGFYFDVHMILDANSKLMKKNK